MVDIRDISGWKKGGSMAGRDIHRVIGTKPDTGEVLHIKISGPTRYQSTSYTVALQEPRESFPNEYIAQGVEDETEAEIKALKYAQEN